MNKKLAISIVIPTMNRPDALENTLSSLIEGDYIPSQIIIVDQSQDEILKRKNKELIDKKTNNTDIEYKYIFQQEPSLTKARNNAMEHINNEIVIYSDDDVLVYSDTLLNVYEIMKDKKISMIAGIDDNAIESNSKIGYLFGTKSFKNRKIGHVTNSMLGRYPNYIDDEIQTQWAMGYFFVIRKSCLIDWNLRWDENLISYAYPEDLDFSFTYYKKSAREGYKCILTNKVHVRHMVSQEYRVPSKKSTFMYVINRRYLIHKHQMGIKAVLAAEWCDFWILLKRTLYKENSKDMRRALKVARKNKKDICEGNLKELYDL